MPWYDNIPDRPLEPPPLPPEEWPICPVCGKETDTFYKDKTGDIVGCGECIRAVDAWEEKGYG